jgi:rRNA maturation endonuclease Nob1
VAAKHPPRRDDDNTAFLVALIGGVAAAAAVIAATIAVLGGTSQRYRCYNCDAVVARGTSPCPNCGRPLGWS